MECCGGVGICGACTILMDGGPVRSCQAQLSEAGGRRFTTIEGLSRDVSHPCQRAWVAEDVAQCGYCQAGMILEAVALLARKPKPTDADVDAAFSDHVCRYGTWQRVRPAVRKHYPYQLALLLVWSNTLRRRRNT
jgi:isoquinoline 1-oxidoreductase alpha subunit